jgi:hypothetical protein
MIDENLPQLNDDDLENLAHEVMYFNGLNGSRGDYLLEPMTPQQFSAIISGQEVQDDDRALKIWDENRTVAQYKIMEGHDPEKLEEAGWGVIFPMNIDPAIVKALEPLLNHRKQMAALQNEKFYRVFAGPKEGVRPNESLNTWIARQGGDPYSPVDPEKMPYYLLIVGDPSQISYRFQFQLDVQYAVGRICFDTVEEYANYARSVVEAEKQKLALPRRIQFFGVTNGDDVATQLSAQHLVAPLVEYTKKEDLLKNQSPWDVQAVYGEKASKACLGSFLGGAETPALLFTASHGMGFDLSDNRLIRHTGALVCKEWPGKSAWKNPVIPDSFYFSADDLPSDARLWGTVAFFFACFGAGTPRKDDFALASKNPKYQAEIAPYPFITRLPQKMLGHPKGGALAVIGHVDRAFPHSFIWNQSRALTHFQSTLATIMGGKPIGLALEDFNLRYAAYASGLTGLLEDVALEIAVNPVLLTSGWTGTNDAKNYVVLGDPFVRVPVAPQAPLPTAVEAGTQRPSLSLSLVNQQSFSTESTEDERQSQPGPVQQTPDRSGEAISPAAVDEAYGLTESLGSFTRSLQQVTQKLVDFLGQTVDHAATLEVRTYTSESIEASLKSSQRPGDLRLRALTSISFTGDVEQILPVRDGEVDRELFDLHMDMVKQAQASRSEMMNAMLAAVASLTNLPGIKPGG